MPFPPPHLADPGHQFCNADSFAMAFDDAWRHHGQNGETEGLSREDTLELILSYLAAHPFAQMDGPRARDVGEFRLRLHGV
jgi:hypothetical protein